MLVFYTILQMNPLLRPPLKVVQAILQTAVRENIRDRKALATIMRRELTGTHYAFPTVQHLWQTYRSLKKTGEMKIQPNLERALRVKDVRTDSGVAPITLLTKPYPCPGKCVYCPTEVRMPKSYISSEPAAARALRLAFDPYAQVTERVETLVRNGHQANKIELIIKGGTWSAYRADYRRWFIKRCFDAANHVGLREQGKRLTRYKNLAASQQENEHAEYRIIGLTIETRPDWVTAKEIINLRDLGCTRVELGIQTLQDEVLKITKRGHTLEATVRAIALLKQAGFKTDAHILPGQPGSTPEKDLEDFRVLFADPRFRPDMVKLYPCVVLPSAELYGWAQAGSFVPLEGEVLRELLIAMQRLLPRYCRISRLVRDFPEQDISHGNKITNLRESLEDEMRKRGTPCVCLRCREVGHVRDVDPKTVPILHEDWYENAGGREVFLSMEDKERKAVYAFLRLRLPLSPEELLSHPTYKIDERFVRESKKIDEAFPALRNTAIVRELHTYGRALNLSMEHGDASQHRGYGRMLMQKAEEIAKREGYKNMAVISGIGVRDYYQTLGYELKETYMMKVL